MGKFKSFTTYTITLLNESPARKEPHVVGIHESGESYENAATPLNRLTEEITRLSSDGVST